jgi:molybdopterin-dependent oxidoreductase alpha subunit
MDNDGTATAPSAPSPVEDPFALLAEGTFPTHAPRPAAAPVSSATLRAIEHSCDASAHGETQALLAQPPREAVPAGVHARSRSAAGLKAILNTFRVALPRMGLRRMMKVFLRANQKSGFDCQSCAWPSPDGTRHQFEFCESGAKAMAAEGNRRVLDAAFFRRWSVDALAAQPDVWMTDQGRLAEPMFRREGDAYYRPISWDEAFLLIGHELNALTHPDRAAFYTSGRVSNEAAFLYQLFVRQFGTNNLPDCSNLCHESSGTALVESLGTGKGTARLSDFEECDLIVIAGQNPGTNHPRMLTSLEHAKKHGARIIMINPLPEVGLLRFTDPNPDEYRNKVLFAGHLLGSGQPLADLHLPVRINGDIALNKGLMKVILAEEAARGGVLDHDFISEHTHGFTELEQDLASTSWSEIVGGCGVARELIEEAGRMIASSKRMVLCWAMGLTQHQDAVPTIRTFVNLLLLGGHIGRPGAGTVCARGHSNVQGDRTMGIWERPTPQFLAALGKEFGFEPPGKHGKDVVDTIMAMLDGEIDVFVAMGGNFLQAGPDTACTATALRQCRLTVHVGTMLNRSHLVTGRQSLLLPCLGRSEVDPGGMVTTEDAMSVVSPSRGVLEPISAALRSEAAIIAGIAQATIGSRSRVDWAALAEDYARIRDHIGRVIPGFEDFNQRIAEGPFYLPNPAGRRRFATATGKAQFCVAPISRHDLPGEQYLLTTIRSHDQFNTTIYGLDDRYRGIKGGRRVLFMHPEDLAARGWKAGQRVTITSHFAEERRKARGFQLVSYPIPRRCVASYFPEANVLVPVESVAAESNTPTYKSIHVSLELSA